MSGKVMHIYRPYVIDSVGKREWCVLLIKDSLLKISLPKKFMEDASYPVRLDPTLGYSTAGNSVYALNALQQKAGGSVAATDGTGGNVTSFHCALTDATCDLKMCIAATSSGDPSGQDVLEQVTFNHAASNDADGAAAGTTALAASTTYGVIVQAAGDSAGIKYDGGSTGLYRSSTVYADQYSDPLSTGWNLESGAVFTTWVVYEAAAGGRTTKNTRPNHLGEQIGMGFGMNLN